MNRSVPCKYWPKPVWNPDVEQTIKFFDGWSRVPEQEVFENAFKVQWELFLKHIVKDEPFPWDLKEGAKGVQLAEKGLESWAEKEGVTFVKSPLHKPKLRMPRLQPSSARCPPRPCSIRYAR